MEPEPLATYQFRQHAFAPERVYSLYEDAIVWDDFDTHGARTGGGGLAAGDVTELELSYAPSRFALSRCEAVAVKRQGGALTLASSHYRDFADFEDRGAAYEAFVRALALVIAAANPGARFTRGWKRSSLLLGFVLGAFVLLLVVALLPVLIAVGWAAIIPVALVFLFGGPAAIAEMRRNWPGVYDPANISGELMPGAAMPPYVDPRLAKLALMLLRR